MVTTRCSPTPRMPFTQSQSRATPEFSITIKAASHGCLRMDPNDAAEVALMVMENSGVARDWEWVKGILGVGDQRVVTMQQMAPLTIVP